MKYDDLEKTQDLFEINEVPNVIENIEMEGATKDDLTEKKETVAPKTKEKKKLKEKWQKLSKKQKIIFIVSLILVLILIISLIIFLLTRKKDAVLNNEHQEETPSIIVEKDNYIYKDGELVLLDEDDNEIGKYECTNKEQELCYVAYYSIEDEFDKPKNLYEDNKEIERLTKIYFNNYVFIYDNANKDDSKIVLYNIKDAKVEDEYSLVKGFSDSNYVILKNKEGKYGSLEFSETGYEENLDFEYDYLGMLTKDSNILATLKNKNYIYNQKGKALTKGLAYSIKSYNDKYLVAYDDTGYYLYDYKSELITDEAYEYMELLDDYVVLISDQKLYLRDYNNNKYNEEGISLKNTNYVVKNIYDANKNLVETKKAYSIEIINDQANITVYNNGKETTSTINLAEGLASSNLAYLNYFDGKLYFYEDEEEKTLLGTYTCSNKNIISKDNLELTNCTIAMESFYSHNEVEVDYSSSLGWLPIYNKRFAFILDTIDVNSPSISLYDLKNKETLSKYASVDALSYTKEKKITFVDTANSYIMAKTSSKNKYGVLNITNEEVKGTKIAFNYENIEKLKDYFVGQENAGTYILLDPENDNVSEKFANKIVDYRDNYVKVINDNKYYVHKMNGEKVDETAYLDISLEADYYVVITTDYKLNILKYNDPNFTLSQEVDVSNTNYKDDYEVIKNSNGYTVKIKSSNQIYEYDENGELNQN